MTAPGKTIATHGVGHGSAAWNHKQAITPLPYSLNTLLITP
jgi:hypothetical protein